MSCLLVCHPHLTSIVVLTAVWAQACGGIRVSFLSALVCWWKQYHGTANSGIDCLDCCPRQFCLRVLVNRHQYHDTVIVVLESETEGSQRVRTQSQWCSERSAGTGIDIQVEPTNCSHGVSFFSMPDCASALVNGGAASNSTISSTIRVTGSSKVPLSDG